MLLVQLASINAFYSILQLKNITFNSLLVCCYTDIFSTTVFLLSLTRVFWKKSASCIIPQQQCNANSKFPKKAAV